MAKRFKGLGWFRPLIEYRMFDHSIVCFYMERIAGGNKVEHKLRASKMISEAKAKGQITAAEGCKLNYRFVTTNVKIDGVQTKNV